MKNIIIKILKWILIFIILGVGQFCITKMNNSDLTNSDYWLYMIPSQILLVPAVIFYINKFKIYENGNR